MSFSTSRAFSFRLLKQDGQARAGELKLAHGTVPTPVFMPVGTQGAVRGQTRETLLETNAKILLANTYHLMRQPGPEVLRSFGGLNPFMKWDRPILTDSGGYQIFSLPGFREMTEKGAAFRSLDGEELFLSPESSIDMQRAIGSDIMMVLDQCIPSVSARDEAARAMELTHRWALRSLRAREDSPQALFAIAQGACFEDLRRTSASFLREHPFDGFAIGGLAVGETKAEREHFAEFTASLLPTDRPRYLMGVGTPIDLLEGVARGVDMFDCILPTQYAQRGAVFTRLGKLQLRRLAYERETGPLDPECECSTCRQYSRGYIHHLLKAGEVLAWQLMGLHNLHFFQKLMGEIRGAILEGSFESYARDRRATLALTDSLAPEKPPKARRRNAQPQLGDYEVVTAPAGHSSIRQKSSGETMHSVSPPEVEARALYVEQIDLEGRLLDEHDGSELVIWDVGLGAASNAMAAVRCFEAVGARARPMRIVSFERDLDPLRLALRSAAKFPHLHHAAPSALARTARWKHPTFPLIWELLEGDFREVYPQAAGPDLIYFDPFSRKVDTELWTPEVFSALRARCTRPALLVTYSASTAVRTALLAAGFWVAEGAPTGPKASTTLGFSAPVAHPGLLGTPWLSRYSKSRDQFPDLLPYAAQVESHPQFRAGLDQN